MLYSATKQSLFALSSFLFLSCAADTNTQTVSQTKPDEKQIFSFCYPKEPLQSPTELFDYQNWTFQYPAGDTCKTIQIKEGYKSKFFSLYSGDAQYIHFALDATEKGTTTNSNFVRSELHHKEFFDSNDGKKRTLEFIFNTNGTDTTQEWDIGQIHIKPIDVTQEHSPLLRLGVKDGFYIAHLKNYATKKYQHIKLSPYTYGTDMKVKIEYQNKNLCVFINDLPTQIQDYDCSTCTFVNYFKVGLYAQTTQGFYEVFIKALKATKQ